MNLVIQIGRLTAEPDIRRSEKSGKVVAKYRLAVDRIYKQDGEPSADFISCVAFGKNGEFVERYLHKGMKIAIRGHLQTGSYTNKDGDTVYTTDVVVESHEFCESKRSGGNDASGGYDNGGYPTIPANSGIPVSPSASDFALLEGDDEPLPF